MKLTTDLMRGIVPDYQTQVLPEDGQVYAFNEQSYSEPPLLSDYATAFDYTNKNAVSPSDKAFHPIYGPAIEGPIAGVGQAEPILSEVVVTKEVPTFDFKKAIIFAAVIYFGYKFFKKGRKA